MIDTPRIDAVAATETSAEDALRRALAEGRRLERELAEERQEHQATLRLAAEDRERHDALRIYAEGLERALAVVRTRVANDMGSLITQDIIDTALATKSASASTCKERGVECPSPHGCMEAGECHRKRPVTASIPTTPTHDGPVGGWMERAGQMETERDNWRDIAQERERRIEYLEGRLALVESERNALVKNPEPALARQGEAPATPAVGLPGAAGEGPGKVTVTTNEAGDCVAVTRTDDEGRILSVLWEREERHEIDTQSAALREQVDRLRLCAREVTPEADGVTYGLAGLCMEAARVIERLHDERLQRYSQSETAEFAIYEGDEFFADVSGPRERAWCEAMSYASQVDNPRIEEVVRTPAPMGELPPLSVSQRGEEPTEAMVIAGFESDAFNHLADLYTSSGGPSCKQAAEAVRGIYKSMEAARCS
jgi:hypothetical protein